MGISSLNHLLREHAKSAFSNIKLGSLPRGCRIAVDLSILMYNIKSMALEGGKLALDLIRDFVTRSKEHGFVLVFVVDGKAGPEKAEEWDRRRDEKAILLERAGTISKELAETTNETKISELTTKLKKLEELTISLKSEEKAAMLDELSKMECIVLYATGEADPLLAYLAKNGYVDYVLSRDTDMFAYGCPYVLREIIDTADSYFDFEYEIVDMSKALIELRLTRAEFLDICILAGCDYFKPSTSTMKYDKYWINAVFSAIKRRKSIEHVIGNGELKKTYSLTITDDEYLMINRIRVMFGGSKSLDEICENTEAIMALTRK